MAADSVEQVLSQHQEQCQSALAAFKSDLQKVRTGRASSGLVEGIVVEYYGSKTPLNSLAQITTPEARQIALQVYDTNAVQAIEKAIQSSGLGLNPSTDGNMIRLNIPALTEESRKDMIRVLHKMAEEIRIGIRNHRRDANDLVKNLEKDSTITKDDSKRTLEKIQKQTDAYIEQVQGMLEGKEAEVMEV